MKTVTFLLALTMLFSLSACANTSPQTSAMEMNSENDPSNQMSIDMDMTAPDGLDTSETQMSELGAFEVSFQSSQPAEEINKIFSWTIHVETSDGVPVEDAEIAIHTSMPEHGHGMPTDPQVTQYLGNGDYLLEGLKYNMPGWWEIKLIITADGESDNVTFNQVLK